MMWMVKSILDLFSGVGVNVLGYNHPKIVQTTMDQVTEVVASTVSF